MRPRATGLTWPLWLLLGHSRLSTAEDAYQWPLYEPREYATPLPTFDTTPTFAPPFSQLSTLLEPRSTTTWGSPGSSPTDKGKRFGNDELSSLWQPIPVSSPPFTTTVSPTPVPTSELIKPPTVPLLRDSGDGLKFPKDFQWGFAGSALQIEGAVKNEGRAPTIWEDKRRDNYSGIAGGGSPDITAMNYYLYKQDIARLAAVGVQSYGFSISWPRVVPFGVAGSPINKQAIDHYSDVIDTILSYGMQPIITLHHFDTPMYYETEDSLLSYGHPEFVDGFVYYAQTILAHFSDRVGTWYTFNEPTTEARLTTKWEFSKNILLAHAKVVRWYRETIKGNALWSIKFVGGTGGFAVPLDPSNSSDVAAANRRNEFDVGYFARPLFLGQNSPQAMLDTPGLDVPVYTDDELQFFNGTADFFAFDVYTISYHSEPSEGFDACAANRSNPLWPQCTAKTDLRDTWSSNFYDNKERIAVPAIHVRAMLGYYQATYPTSGGIMVAEYGMTPYKASSMSVPHLQNDLTQSYFYISFMREVLKAIHTDGIHVIGLHGWSFLDNWEWSQYADHYGVQAFNRTTQQRFYKRCIFDYVDFMKAHLDD